MVCSSAFITTRRYSDPQKNGSIHACGKWNEQKRTFFSKVSKNFVFLHPYYYSEK